ncbi:hypothetical protein HLB23_07870 [Nocardia uniformis]|uniref:Uncharacterized protein n=1 Tax=Nocardia uniformis TaxID=53432 RepID=A0A849BUD3_9NOCA|nr:hypothetical protein [Nocardia uniformis]NNH69784.1 hypothetical protein [Nocardia uniformis]
MNHSRTLLRTLAAVGAITALAGSATAVALRDAETVSGTPIAGEIDVRTLDTGSYPTEAWDAHDDAYVPFHSDYFKVAAMRLADHVATAFDIEPSLKYQVDLVGDPGFSKAVPSAYLGEDEDTESIAERNNLLFGFQSSGSDQADNFHSSWDWPRPNKSGSTIIGTVVMQFPDAEAADRAATEFYDADFNRYRDRNEAVALTDYAGAHSHWQPGKPTARSFLAHGSYVVAVLASTPTADRGALAELVSKAYRVQLPMLDALAPISDEEMLDLPWDPDRLLHRTLNPSGYAWPDTEDGVVVGPQGILHYAVDRATAKSAYTAMGVEKAAIVDDTTLIRTADVASAERAVTERRTTRAVAGGAEGPPDIPNSSCVENEVPDKRSSASKYTCLIAYDRYVAYVNSDQLLDAHQRAAAQYAILANG